MDININTNENMSVTRTPEEIRQEFNRVRHKAERPLYYLLVVINICIIAVLLFVPEVSESLVEETGEESYGGFFGWIIVVTVIVGLIFGFYKQYGEKLSYSVRVTPMNFPEIYETSVEYARMLGLKKVPEIYICQENGTLNAFATWVFGKRYIQLNAEIVDIAYMENKDLDTVRFVLGHEFGHVYMKHVTLAYNLGFLFAKLIPVLGALMTRAQEYSADRVAQILTQQTGTKCMTMLTAGRHLYAYVDTDDYINNILKEKNLLEHVSYFFVNLFASHPIMPFRIKAIMDPERKSGRLI